MASTTLLGGGLAAVGAVVVGRVDDAIDVAIDQSGNADSKDATDYDDKHEQAQKHTRHLLILFL